MRCDDARGLLPAYHDAELGRAELPELQRHLETCGPCRTALDGMRRVSGMFDALRAVRAPDTLRGKLATASPRRRPAFGGPMLAAAASFLLFFGAAWGVAGATGPSAAPGTTFEGELAAWLPPERGGAFLDHLREALPFLARSQLPEADGVVWHTPPETHLLREIFRTEERPR